MARACCSAVLTATKRMVGRLAASAIASASAVSFFWRLTKRLTYAGGIKRTSCPASRIARPPVMCAPAGLHDDDSVWPLGKKAEDFLTRELLSKGYASIR